MDTMDQSVGVLCNEHKEDISGICTDKICKDKDRLGCFICFKKNHVNCSKSANLTKQDILEEFENIIKMQKQNTSLLLNKDTFLQIKKDIVTLLHNIELQINAINEQKQVLNRIIQITKNPFSKQSWYDSQKILQSEFKSAEKSEIFDQFQEVKAKIDYLLSLETRPMCDWEQIAIRETIDTKSPINCMACSSNADFIACASKDGIIRIFELELGALVTELKGNYQSIRTLSYSPDNKYIASSSDDKTIVIWDIKQRKQDGETLKGHTSYVETVCYSPDCQYLVTGSQDNTIRIWSIQNRKEIKCLYGHTSPVFTIDYSSNGKLLASAGFDNKIRLWNAETWDQLEYSLVGHVGCIYSIKFSKNGKKLISGGQDYSLRLWEVQTGKQLKCFNGHTSLVSRVIYSFDEKYIISGSQDMSIRVWNVNSGQSSIMKGYKCVSSLCISPDGRYLISAGGGSLIKVERVKYE